MTAILWFGNSPTVGTGYGTQAAQVIRRAVDNGHHVTVTANYGAEGAESTWTTPEGHTVPILPRGLDLLSRDVLLDHWNEFTTTHGPTSRFIALTDAFVIPHSIYEQAPVEVWVPIEHAPIPPDIDKTFNSGTQARPIAMSKWGQAMLQQGGIESTYIPHAVEPTFRITPGGCDIMGVPDDAFIVSIIAANKGWAPARKAWAEQLMAFQRMSKECPDAVLYLHTDPTAPGSVTLRDVVKTLGLESKVFFPDRSRYVRFGYTPQDLAAIYTATDIVLSASMGEGFGLCPLEAAACGTPAIVSDFSAQPELACSDSYVVPGQLWWHQGRRAFLFLPSVEGIGNALIDAYNNPVPESAAAIALAAEYDADKVYKEYWAPYLDTVPS